jgi:hypothetical protein
LVHFLFVTIQAPSGKTYNFYGQKIDLDLEIPKKGITNREWMKKGRNHLALE